jgi:riboflavin synthase
MSGRVRGAARRVQAFMFTGIIEGTGSIVDVQPLDRAMRLVVEAPDCAGKLMDGPGEALGASVSISGVCLTVVAIDSRRLSFDLIEETLQRSTLGRLIPGRRVNLERPLKLNSLLDGHLVQGHVDGVGITREVDVRGDEIWIRIEAEASLLRYVVEKGSIAVDGVSLTVAALDADSFSVAIIPHTARVTTLGELTPGDPVNLEADVIARHLEKLAAPYLQAVPGGAAGWRI